MFGYSVKFPSVVAPVTVADSIFQALEPVSTPSTRIRRSFAIVVFGTCAEMSVVLTPCVAPVLHATGLPELP